MSHSECEERIFEEDGSAYKVPSSSFQQNILQRPER